ncbi:MAG: alpha/beta fold hydrolase [Actinomycetales bacterium]
MTGTLDVPLHDTRYGESGPRVAFCHGLFGQGRNWTTFAKALSVDHRVVLVDMPNHGRSGSTHDFDYHEQAAIVAEHLRSIEDVPWRLVGHSMGGKIAMMVALAEPELVERLCVVDMSPVAYAASTEIHSYATAMQAIDMSELGGRSDADQQLLTAVPNDEIRGFLLQNLRRKDGRWGWQLNLDLLVERLDELSGWPEVDAQYPGPVLWVAGDTSDYIKPEYADRMRAHFPSTRLVTIKNAGHWVHSEQPQIFAETLRLFLDQAAA